MSTHWISCEQTDIMTGLGLGWRSWAGYGSHTHTHTHGLMNATRSTSPRLYPSLGQHTQGPKLTQHAFTCLHLTGGGRLRAVNVNKLVFVTMTSSACPTKPLLDLFWVILASVSLKTAIPCSGVITLRCRAENKMSMTVRVCVCVSQTVINLFVFLPPQHRPLQQ